MTDCARIVVSLLVLASIPVQGQNADNAAPADTLRSTDSVALPAAATIADSILLMNPNVDLDTLNDAQRMLIEFETRYRMRQQDEPKASAALKLSFQDSLTAYYLPARWNLREDIDRSFYHDAGDYFRFDPSFFVLEPQIMPMRKTVQPYGLAGDRLAILAGGKSRHPFEHVVEPDGLMDLSDIPTALDHTVALLPGPVGMIFGADHSVASLYTLPERSDSTNPRSSFIVDKGIYSYSNARGRYAKEFTDGRQIDMSIAYRNSDGIATGTGDDAYFYTGNFIFPLGEDWEFQVDGQLYDRTGVYQVRHLEFGAPLQRDRIDRNAQVRIGHYNSARDVKYGLTYSHLRQGSALTGNYDRNLNQTGNGLAISRQWFGGGFAFKAELSGDQLTYDTWSDKYTRMSAGASLQLARLSRPWGVSAVLKQNHVDDFGFLPSAALLLQRDAEKSLFSLSVGYSERAPSMNELLLPYLEARLYQTDGYADQGNPELISEKMLDGSLQLAIGRPDNSLSLALNGGKIWDGIDWVTSRDPIKTIFTPRNGDIDFAAVTAIGRVRLADFMRLRSGASYNQVEYASIKNRVYAPEYQAFSGMELHLFWRQKLIDFYAYGELVYVGPYDGYVESGLGDEVVTNVKLSFKMGHFRFHWIVQNSLSAIYNPRDYWKNPGYAGYYGFVWDFLD